MGSGGDSEMGFQNGDESGSSSGNRVATFFSSGWHPVVSLGQHESFGVGSSMVSHGEFSTSPYPLQNQGVNGFPHYSAVGSSYVDMVPKLPCYGSGNFSDMVPGSFGISECLQIPSSDARSLTDGAPGNHDRKVSEGGASPDGKRRKRAPDSENVVDDYQTDSPNETSIKHEEDKKSKLEQSVTANLRGKQGVKQVKESCNSGEDPKENYIHVRARRGQATNSHSLAERVRREKISERMRLLQELVPGCNKITGKAVMLDEIINYVQSLQQQVEFLSMKLATVNPELNVDVERILSKDVIHSRSDNARILGFSPEMTSSHPYPYSHGMFQRTMPSIHCTNPPFPSLPQTIIDNELQNLFQTGFDSRSSLDDLASHGKLKPEL